MDIKSPIKAFITLSIEHHHLSLEGPQCIQFLVANIRAHAKNF